MPPSVLLEIPVEQRHSASLLQLHYNRVRRFTEFLCRPLAIEDHIPQSMTDASPTKWHLAHTSWFFERFVIKTADPRHRPLRDQYFHLFNSYYHQAGTMYPRPRRGLITRPTVAEVYEYRAEVDAIMRRLLSNGTEATLEAILPIVEIGLHHEQQHQELILTDLKHLFSHNPLRPSYARSIARADQRPGAPSWAEYTGGLVEIGHEGGTFAYDNEGPRHQVYLQPFRLATRPVTCGEYLEFMHEDGYGRVELWLSDGWATVHQEGWRAPLYWEQVDGRWWQFTMSGMRPVDPAEPVCHVSFYEADAFARWAGARLPLEAEWEHAAAGRLLEGNFVEQGRYHPAPAAPESRNGSHGGNERRREGGARQLFGDVWEWTASPYTAYPGFRTAEGGLGEYNGKFMSSQMVLRGGSCLTSRSHIRPTYRNFFYPAARWQMSGIRLAADA